MLCLVGYYILFRRKESHYSMKAAVLSVAALVAYFGVRLLVLHHVMQYRQVSNVSLDHVAINLKDSHWPVPFLFTVGAYLPLLVLAWRRTPPSLSKLSLYLVVVLFVSSMLFGWLSESRNYMPAVFVLSVIAARFFASEAEYRRTEVVRSPS